MVRESKAILTAGGKRSACPATGLRDSERPQSASLVDKSISIKGWVAQLAEQWTEIRCYYLETSGLPLNISERLRTKTTILDAHNVNIASTASATDMKKRCGAMFVCDPTGCAHQSLVYSVRLC
jgi:hypothetical protein